MVGREGAIGPMIREWAERLGQQAGLGEGCCAEGFQRIDTA
jgi:hypothetical protein